MKLPNMPKVLSSKEFELVRLVFRHQLYNRSALTSPLVKWSKELAESIMAGKNIHGYILDRAITILRDDLPLPERNLNDICVDYRRKLMEWYNVSDGTNPKRFIFNHSYYKYQLYNAIHHIPRYGISSTAELLKDIKYLTDVVSNIKTHTITQHNVVKLLYGYPDIPEQEQPRKGQDIRSINREFKYIPINRDMYELEIYGSGYLFRKLTITSDVLDPTNLALYNYGRDRSKVVQENILKLIKLNDIIYRLHRRNDKRADKGEFLRSLIYTPKSDYNLHERIEKLESIFQAPPIID